ncbi:MAG: Fic family protein [Planctomycetota bacterium]|nr:Fic family protein [Planctomycetota bacterium]
MMSFRKGPVLLENIPASAVWLLTDIAEAKGRQYLCTKQAPQVLRALREMSIVQSTVSSNRIEGVTISPDRVRPLVLGHAKPRDRSEAEIIGYRQALNLIHTSHDKLTITPETLQRLHRMIQEGAGDAGQWKQVENEIIEFRAGAAPVIRFRPVPVARTPAAIEELCVSYRHTVAQGLTPDLVAIAGLVLDFLCIHPFRDGNGRVSRLLTLMVLYQHGYEVGRYVSLERLVEESKEDYYAVLQRSSEGWHDGTHDMLPWLNYFLAVLRRAYLEFQQRAGENQSRRGAKTALVEAAIAGFLDEFTLADLERACPGVSRDMVRRVLRDFQKAGLAECLGRGPGTKWRKKGNTSKRG